MPSVEFKLMGVFGDKGERQILVDGGMSLKEVKELVKKKFTLMPKAKITFLWQGKRYGEESNHIAFKRLPIDPRSDRITVIVSNPY
ncbi:MAG: hypothetical protein R6U96_00730 [Promethearchaeia archaeon]